MNKLMNLIALSALLAVGAQAGMVITLDDPDQTGFPGQTLSFTGTITNTDTNSLDPAIYLNSDDLTFDLSDAGVNDDFFSTVPFFLAPNTSSGDIDLFDITLANPETQPYGPYTGTYVLLGGADASAGTASDNLAQVSFSVNAVPEPATLALFGTGLVLLGRRQRRALFG